MLYVFDMLILCEFLESSIIFFNLFSSSILLISKIERSAKSHKMSNYEFFEILIAMIDF